MDVFGKKEIASLSRQQAAMQRDFNKIVGDLKSKNTQLQAINGISKAMTAQMSQKSNLTQFYNTGIKQGPFAGVRSTTAATSRRLSRVAHGDSPVAQSFVSTINTLTVGHGLEPESQPIWDLIPGGATTSVEARSEWTKKVEARYKLWAKKKTISYAQDMNRYQQEQINFEDLLIDGEYFELYRYSNVTKRNPLTIQRIRPEDVRTPSGSMALQGNTEDQGIEYDQKGIAVAYHIYDHNTLKTVRVLTKGTRSGRVFVNHVKLGGNRRGVGILANMITELMKLGDYEVLELQAAVVNALYAVWVGVDVNADESVPVLSGGIGDEAQQTTESITTEQWMQNRKELNYNQGGLELDVLPAGHKVQSFDTKRPNVNFGNFTDQVIKNLSSAKNMPISVIQKQFQNSYSASRGELILAWYEIDKYRFNQSMTNDLVYRMWMWGEVVAGRIVAAGFDTEEIQDAWVNCKWIGNQRPDIDPLRSVKAHVMEHNRAYKTGKQITAERGGGDYESNLDTVGPELTQVAKNQEAFAALQMDVDLNDQ